MSLDLLLGVKSKGAIGIVKLDAVLYESHDYQNNVTEFPVEQGYSISDHVVKLPESVSIEGLVSDSPISYLQGLFSAGDFVTTAFNDLLKIAGYPLPAETLTPGTLPQIITIVTGLRRYENMVMSKMTVTRDPNTGDALHFTSEFKRLNVVTTSTTVVNSSELLGKARNAVNQAAKKTPAATQTSTSVTDAGKTIAFSLLGLK